MILNVVMKLIGYYGSWNLYANPKLIPMNTTGMTDLSHISYCFMNIGPTGNVVLGDPWADIQISLGSAYGDSSPIKSGYLGGNLHNLFRFKKANRNIKTGIEYGGYTFSTNVNAVLNSNTYSQNLANGIRTQVRNFGVDYIGLDFEGTFSTPRVVQLLQKIKTNLPSTPIFYSLGASFVNTYTVQTLQQMNPHIDTWNLMCIDFAGSWSTQNNLYSNALYPDCQNMVNYLVSAGVASSKIVIEIQGYGNPSGQSSYGNNFIYNQPSLISWESTYGTIYNPTVVSQSTYDPNGVMISYDSPQSVTDKMGYINTNGLGGMSFWMMGYDRVVPNSLVKTARNLVTNLDTSQNNLVYSTSVYTNIKNSNLAIQKEEL